MKTICNFAALCRYTGPVILITLFIGATAATVSAQSGRKLPDWNKKQPAPSPAPDPAQRSDQPQSKPKITLVVTSFLPEINSSVILTNEVVESCMDRLGLSSAFDIAREDQMNRKEAIDKAKGMKSGYLLYMELDLDTADRDLAGIGPQDYSNLYVWYMLYEAQTGKIKTQGHVYQRPAYNGVPVPTTQGNIEYPLQQAGRETADRIMQAVGVALPPGH